LLPREKTDRHLMRQLFTSVAPRYDLITRLFSFGMDRRWKTVGVAGASIPENSLALDLACGTGDFSRLLLRRNRQSRVVALDLTEPMLRLAKADGAVEAVCADATNLPFAGGTFHCVLVGYGLRNFPNLPQALAEIQRVIKPGGLLVSLDFFLPENRVFRRLYLGYLFVQGAFWGLLLHGRPRTYTYIWDSLRSFLSIQEFSSLLRTAGYQDVRSRGFILGGIAVHWARR
jgi:demethylmenaquinone methyltransferase / 2-methoxy-6-polyprenyl-1,4-benzoquinol methylase